MFRKQIFYAMSRFILNGINISALSSAWTNHKTRFVNADNGRFVLEQFEIWSDAIKLTLINNIASLLEKLIYTHAGDDKYCRYVDWIVSVGVVPISEIHTIDRQRNIDIVQREFMSEISSYPLFGHLDISQQKTLKRCIEALMVREIPNTPDIRIHRLKSNGLIECFSGKRRLKRYIYAEPIMLEEERLILTTPLARIRYEYARHNELRTHRKICQLLNTNPVKTVTSSRHEMNTRRIVELMEKRDRHVDAKTSIVKFLLNVSDSKSKIGLEDSVESFLQDLTPSVDQSRLMPSRIPIQSTATTSSGTQDIRELFRRQVIRCLEDQIQDHVEEIENLKLLNKTWENKTRELRDTLDRYESEGRRTRGPPSSDLQTIDTFSALRRIQNVPNNPVSIDDNRVVCNSFFSQFVPDEKDSDNRLSSLWENEYFRCFRFRKDVTNQGTEDSTSYSNYTIERVLLPFLTSVINFPMLDPIPEEYLFLSLGELATVVYETSKVQRYTDFLRYRETIRLIPTQPDIPSETRNRSYIPYVNNEPPTKIRVAEAYTTPFYTAEPKEPSQTEYSQLKFKSPGEKIRNLRDRNVQHLNG